MQTIFIKERPHLVCGNFAFFDKYGLHTPDPTLLEDGEGIGILPPEIGEIPVAVTDGRAS